MAGEKKNGVDPVGQSVEGFVAQRLKADPEFRAAYERNRPYREIAKKAILRRGELGLSQDQVARRMATSKSAVSRIESGRHRTSLLTLERLAEALEMELEVAFKPKRGATVHARRRAGGPPARSAAS